MKVDSIDIGQNDDQSWHVNLYGKDELGTTRRETFADNMTHSDAQQLARLLERHHHKLIM